MIKKMVWDAFKNTGDINMYLELKQIEDIEEQLEKNNLKDEHFGKEGINNGNNKS